MKTSGLANREDDHDNSDEKSGLRDVRHPFGDRILQELSASPPMLTKPPFAFEESR